MVGLPSADAAVAQGGLAAFGAARGSGGRAATALGLRRKGRGGRGDRWESGVSHGRSVINHDSHLLYIVIP